MVLLKLLEVLVVKINVYYQMRLYLKACVILKYNLNLMVNIILLEFAHQKDQKEMERIKMVGQ